jgi:peptidoglycan/xylan/chitin deacetylase (PgdA/CDA1 family)
MSKDEWQMTKVPAMPLWRSLLLHLYYHASMPVRWWNHVCAVAEYRVPMIVLFYHRVADDRATPWTMSNRMFLRQIRWLQERFEFISLEETQRRIGRGGNYRPCVSITFDDAYSDNCRQAIPLLVKERIPCTYFVTARNVLEGDPFPHDLVYGHALAPNTIDQLRAMAGAGIEIGSHTYTHADLGAMTDRRLLRYEVAASGKDLQAAIGRPVRYFAFPFGHHAHLSSQAFELAREAGYEAVCSAYGGVNYPGDDAFHIQRIPADDSMIRLKNWMTLDPRKMRIPRFEYRATESEQMPVRKTVDCSQ